MSKIRVLLVLVFMLFVSGCDSNIVGNKTVDVRYDYVLTSFDDCKEINNLVGKSRTCELIFYEGDNYLFENALIALSNAYVESSPKYKSRTYIDQSGKAIVSDLYERPNTTDYIKSNKKFRGMLAVTLVDEMTKSAAFISYHLERERPVGWFEQSKSYVLSASSREGVGDEAAFFVYITMDNRDVLDDEFLRNNVYLEDYQGKRYKISQIDGNLIVFPYIIGENDSYLRIVLYDYEKIGSDMYLQWNFQRKSKL